jgi:hypothetical protein
MNLEYYEEEIHEVIRTQGWNNLADTPDDEE